MRFLMLIPFMLAMLLSSAWEPPSQCADEDREIPGNRSTPCKLVLPDLERIEYRFRMDYPVCREEMVFHLPGLSEMDPLAGLSRYAVRILGSEQQGTEYPHFVPFSMWRASGYLITTIPDQLILENGYGGVLDLNSPVVEKTRFQTRPATIYLTLRFHMIRKEEVDRYYFLHSNDLPNPNVAGRVALANSCLDLVRQEKQQREHAAAVAKAEAKAQAQATAQADAANKAAEQARLEAEAQARIAILETKTAVEARKQVQEAELLRTKTLIKDIEHRQELGAILRDIVRIRLAGEEDRARLTNEYLLNVSTTVATFDEEVRAIEAKIQEYVEFNRKLLNQLEAYHAGLIDRLRQANESVVEQQERIGSLEQQIEQLETELESPVPTTTEQ